MVGVLWCLFVIFKLPQRFLERNAGIKFLAKMQGTPLASWDVEMLLIGVLYALLPPILIAGAWKAMNWLIKEQDEIRREQMDKDSDDEE